MKKRTGLLFGSFNPIHIGHLAIASWFAEFTDLKQVWLVVSLQNPLKGKETLLNENTRLEMAQLATEDDSRLYVSSIEFSLPRPSYTIDTLKALEEKHPDREWVLLMGSDAVATLPRWKQWEDLVRNYEIMVYARPKHGGQLEWKPADAKLTLFEDVPQMEISASFIREALGSGKDIRYLLHPKVLGFIEKWGYYLNK